MTVASMEADLAMVSSFKTQLRLPILLPLERILYIYYPIRFKKDEAKIHALLDSNNEIIAMTLDYADRLGLKIRSTNIRAQKIDSSTLETFGMVLASF